MTAATSIVEAAQAEGERVLGTPVSATGPVVDPVEINANVAELRSAAGGLHADARELGLAIEGTAAMIVITGKLVHELRGLVFGMVRELATELTRNAHIAAAAAPHTNGGSIAVFCGVANARTAATAARIRDRIAALLEALGRQTGRLVELEELMRVVTP